MSYLEYSNYKGFGEHMREVLWYSQAVCIGDRIEIAGQGTSSAFAQAVLPDESQAAGTQTPARFMPICQKNSSKRFPMSSWRSRTREARVGTRCTEFASTFLTRATRLAGLLVQNLRRWMPNHQPVLACVGVKELVLNGMRIEIKAYAQDDYR